MGNSLNTAQFTMNTTTLTTGQEKSIALKQHLGEDCFILEDAKEAKIYEGTKEDAREQFDEQSEDKEGIISFYLWCAENLTEVEEYEEDSYNDYLVLTDEEADEKWEESLDSYLEDCVYPELPKEMVNYFDDAAWKRDAKMDGRGHSLSGYDGNEDKETVNETTYYIYRIN